MTGYETISLLVSLLAVIVAAVSLYRTRRTEAKQLELQEAQTALAKFQHKVLAAEQEARGRADLRVSCERNGRDRRFVFSNVGGSVAKNVHLAFANTGLRKAPVVPAQFNEPFPIAEFRPGETHHCVALVTLDTPSVLTAIYSWEDASGAALQQECKIAL